MMSGENDSSTQDVVYVDTRHHDESTTDSGVFDVDVPPSEITTTTTTTTNGKNKHVRAQGQPRTLLNYFSRANERSSGDDSAAKRVRTHSLPTPPQKRTLVTYMSDYGADSTRAKMERVVSLAATKGQTFNSEKLLVIKKLLEGVSMSVFGKPGTAKTSTLAWCLDELPDTWIFSNSGIASSNLLEAYASQRGLTMTDARLVLLERNTVIKHYDAFFAILLPFRSYADWDKCTSKATLANLLEKFRTPPKRIIFEEACNIPSAKYAMIDRICNRMAEEVHNEQNRMKGTRGKYKYRYMAADAVCYFGDPRQLVPTDPKTGEPDRLMDSAVFKETVPVKHRLALTKIERQVDPVFQRVVGLIGDGDTDNDEVQFFMRQLPVISEPKPGDGVVIVPYRSTARKINDRLSQMVAVETPDDTVGKVRVYEVSCQYDTLADTRIKRKAEQKQQERTVLQPPPPPPAPTGDGDDDDEDEEEEVEEEEKGPRTNWVDVTKESHPELYKRIILHGEQTYNRKDEDLATVMAEAAQPVKLRYGTPCFYGTNNKRFEQYTNGTPVIIVGWAEKRNLPIVMMEGDAEEYKAEKGVYGYDPKDLKTGKAVVVTRTVSRFSTLFKRTGNTEGKSFVCRKIVMKLRPAFAMTVHKAQGKTVEKSVIDPNPGRQFAPGQFFVALTRSRNRPSLSELLGPNFKIKVDKYAIELCKVIERNMRALCEENGIAWDC